MDIKETIIGLAALVSASLVTSPSPLLSPVGVIQERVVLAQHQLDLTTRHKDPKTNEVFAYNILLALEYFDYGFELKPGEIFAFHEHVLPEFENRPLKTPGTLYTTKEGYKSSGGLPGNGVCHLATLINWTASDAGLKTIAKVNHNFAPVPEIPKGYGVSIRSLPETDNAQNQNLYVTNNFDFPVGFIFEIEGENLTLKVTK